MSVETERIFVSSLPVLVSSMFFEAPDFIMFKDFRVLELLFSVDSGMRSLSDILERRGVMASGFLFTSKSIRSWLSVSVLDTSLARLMESDN